MATLHSPRRRSAEHGSNGWRGLLAVVLLAAITCGAAVAAPQAHARNQARDPLVQWDQQRKRTEEHKSKRRENFDLQGAEVRDAKKSAAESRQNEMQNELGRPNTQTDRWTGY